MDQADTLDTTFLVDNKGLLPDRFFQGYCFVGSDYVYGAQGAELYEYETGSKIRAGCDGCYVIAEKVSGGMRFGNDFAGYKILYYYHDGVTWIVSNSYARIVARLRDFGLPALPNYAQLSAISGPGSGHSQLFSFETPTRGIRMLPRASTLVMNDAKAVIESWPNAANLSYSEGLSAHLELWLQRFETLMLDPRTNYTIDVTGGVDSRTNLAFVIRARERLGGYGGLGAPRLEQPRLNCGSNASNLIDLEVATELTNHFGLELNDMRRFARQNLSQGESFRTFVDLNAGVYYPIYMPVSAPMPANISIGGGGGEIHRRFYENHQRSKDVERFFRSYSGSLRHPWMSQEFEYHGRVAINEIRSEFHDPLRAHYREFRHRHHVGRAPRYGVTFTPLDSVSADVAQSRAGDARLDEGQFNYDIMSSLKPELLDMRFDSASKAPTSAIRDRLCSVAVSSTAEPGKVWIPDVEIRRVRASSVSRGEALSAAVEACAENHLVVSFLGESTLQDARELTESMSTGRSVGNAVNLKPVSSVIAADIAFGGDGGVSAVDGLAE